MHQIPRLRSCALVFLSMLVLLGCGQLGPPMGRVSGRITYKDQPVPKATVSFMPKATGARPAIGFTDDAGYYHLTTTNPRDGALVGEHLVGIVAKAPYDGPIPPGAGAALLEELETQGKPLIPEKYFNSDTSGLTASVKAGSNTLDFALTEAL
jgi:hypothetical protein